MCTFSELKKQTPVDAPVLLLLLLHQVSGVLAVGYDDDDDDDGDEQANRAVVS